MTHLRTLLAFGFLLSVAIGASAMPSDSAAIRPILLDHVHRYPKLEVQDLYKFVYHAAMGNEHLMTDTVGIRAYLDLELASIDTDSIQPRYEPLTPDSSLVRLNLRPFKASGGDPAKLFQAMLATASQFQQSRGRLRSYWSALEALAQEHLIPFPPNEFDSFFCKMEQAKFPAVHHSPSFERRYKPAYRLVLRSLIQQ